METNFIFYGVLMILPVISSVPYVQLFHSDYSYDANAGGWLKFHRVPLRWEQAHLVCHEEGAVLASPTNKNISKAVTSLMIEHGVTTTSIFTGISTINFNGILKFVEGVSVSNTYTQTSTSCVGMKADGTTADISCSDFHPFVCFLKKENNVITECGTTDTEYVFDNRTGSCYKVYRDQHKWDEASLICAEQGGHLAVINSQAEAEVIWELAKDSSSKVEVLIGFHSDYNQTSLFGNGRKWITVQGESLEEAGYSRWFKDEPNSFDGNCGSVIFTGSKQDGILSDAPCRMDLMFICENEPNRQTVKTSISEPQALKTDENEQQTEEKDSTAELQVTIVKDVCDAVPECNTQDKEYVINNQTGSCYKIHKQKRSWTEGYDICVAEGGHLAVINSEEEADVIWKLATDRILMPVSIGFRADNLHSIVDGKRTWTTVQGQTLEDAGYARWFPGEPDSLDENCGSGFFLGLKDVGILKNVPCDADLIFICEIESKKLACKEPQETGSVIKIEENVIITEPTESTEKESTHNEVISQAVPEWNRRDKEYVFSNRTGSCYKVSLHGRWWTDAEVICADEGGHLAVINSQEEADVIWELAAKTLSPLAVSIGFSVNNLTYTANGERTWTTVQGQTLEEAGYARWAPGEPNSLDENCGSVFFRGQKHEGILNDVPCDIDLIFICEIESEDSTCQKPQIQIETVKETEENEIITNPTTEDNDGVVSDSESKCGTADKDYVLSNQTGSCYKVHKTRRHWNEANDICAAEGGHLAIVNSENEAEVIWEIANENWDLLAMFLGFRADNSTSFVNGQRTWITVQGQTLEDAGYARWYPGEPNSLEENCGSIYFQGPKSEGILNDAPCDWNLLFICEIELK